MIDLFGIQHDRFACLEVGCQKLSKLDEVLLEKPPEIQPCNLLFGDHFENGVVLISNIYLLEVTCLYYS